MHRGKPCGSRRDAAEDRAGQGDERCRDTEVLTNPTGRDLDRSPYPRQEDEQPQQQHRDEREEHIGGREGGHRRKWQDREQPQEHDDHEQDFDDHVLLSIN